MSMLPKQAISPFLTMVPCRKYTANYPEFNIMSHLSYCHTFFKCYLPAAEIVQPFPHTINLQQTTLKLSRPKTQKSLQMIVKLLNRVEIIVANGEIAHHEQFLHLPH